MSKTLIRQTDDAFQTFRELSERLMAELAEHRALIADYDTLVEERIQTINAGCTFLFETAVAVYELGTAKRADDVLAGRGIAMPPTRSRRVLQ